MELNPDQEPEDSLLFSTFNQDGSNFAIGTEKGFRIYNSYPLRYTVQRILYGGIGKIEMLNKCNVLALVGGGSNPKYAPNKVILWNDLKEVVITEIIVKFCIKNIKLKRELIFIIGENEIRIFTFGNFQSIDTISTFPNKNGILGISLSSQSNIIAYPDVDMGKISIKNYGEKISNINNDNNGSEYKSFSINAHQSEITALAMNHDGSLVASASEKGTIIRIFKTKDGQQIQELRRGTESAEIFCLCFDYQTKYLACSSNKGTVHIFNVKNEKNEVQNQKSIFGTISSFFGIQSEYLNSEWSFAQFRINSKERSVVSFCPDGTPSVMVLTSEGKYYQGSFDPNKGGECATVLEQDFMKMEIVKDDD